MPENRLWLLTSKTGHQAICPAHLKVIAVPCKNETIVLLIEGMLFHPQNKYIRPGNTRTKMYAGRVAYCPLVSHVEYAKRAVIS